MATTVNGSFHTRLRRLRQAAGLSQRDLSTPSATYAYISRLEAGERHPSAKVLQELARKLNVTPLYLERGEVMVCPYCHQAVKEELDVG